MSTIRVYRLEDPHNVGPYHSKIREWISAEKFDVAGRVQSVMDKRHCRTLYHRNRIAESWFPRTPSENQFRQFLDVHSAGGGVLAHGCQSEESLKQWFGIFYQMLLAIGFVLAVYEVNAEYCFVFPEQAVFVRSKAQKVS